MLGILFSLTPSYRQSTVEVNTKNANWCQKMPIFTAISQSAIDAVGCQTCVRIALVLD
jgi:hypothetical protein